VERTKGKTIFFTHIPKTGGTSLEKTLFRRVLSAEGVYQPKGYWELITDRRSFRYLGGHRPYGMHRLSEVSNPRYYTVLRDPVERAISFYYECLWPRGDKKVADHPEHATAWKHDLVAFYQIPRFRNVQARMLAGLWAEILGRYISLDRVGIGRLVTTMAKRHLKEKYVAFGITERFEESRQWMATTLGADVPPIKNKHKTNPDRPTASDLSASQRAALRRLNRLDVEVYEFACHLFEQKRSKTGV
jgi:hypothetical protein